MKVILIQPDGMADEPVAQLGNKTPLQAAYTPSMDWLASAGLLGTVHSIPAGFPPGSDIGNLVLMGHDPNKVFTGRAPLEAAAQGISTTPQDVIYRVNFVHIDQGVMVDFTAGHISNEEAAELISALNQELGIAGLRLYPGVSYRNLGVWHQGAMPTQAEPPHNLTDKPIEGFDARPDSVRAVMDRARDILARHPVNHKRVAAGKKAATHIWMWGEGRMPTLRSIGDMYGWSHGTMITAVDLLRGIARLSGVDVVDVEGATGFIDTNYEGKAQAALDALDRSDLVFVHIEAPDESAHMGRSDYKLKSIEDTDAKIVAPLLRAARQRGDTAIVLLPDHPTLIRTKTHSADPVPCLVAYPEHLRRDVRGDERAYSESTQPVDFELPAGWELLQRVQARTLARTQAAA